MGPGHLVPAGRGPRRAYPVMADSAFVEGSDHRFGGSIEQLGVVRCPPGAHPPGTVGAHHVTGSASTPKTVESYLSGRSWGSVARRRVGMRRKRVP